ncbi:MAG: homoserine kinase, partial [Acidimicrobiia bacterium]
MTVREVASASAPASSGNLGPGFDVLGLALDLRCVVEAVPADRMTVDDGDGPVDLGSRDMLFGAVMAAVDRPMALVVDNAIPRTRGLGSSSAVTAAAAAAALLAVGREPVREEIYELVAGIEGHGDNAAPAVYGGLMAVGSNGPHRLEMD